MDISAIIGENLKRLRLERNWSLGQLADRSGVSKVMLSQIEKQDSNPSIHTIWKIADALQVPYTALLEQDIHGGAVISAKDLPMQTLDAGQGTLRCYYHHAQHRNFELFQMTIPPDGTYASQGHGERTDEYALVESGVLEMTLEDGVHVLESDDVICFHSNKKHTYHNAGDTLLKLLILNYYR